MRDRRIWERVHRKDRGNLRGIETDVERHRETEEIWERMRKRHRKYEREWERDIENMKEN